MTTRWALVALVACGGKDDEEPTDDGTEPPECVEDTDCERLVAICEAGACVDGDRDDDFGSARAIELGEDNARAGVIFPEGDVDTFVYEAAEPQWVSVRTVTQDESPLDTVVQVWNADGDLHAAGDDYPVWPYRVSGFDTVLYAYLPSAGTWYVTVEDASTFYGEEPRAGEDFTFDVLIREANGTREPDAIDDPAVDVTVADGNTVYVTGVLIEEPGDSDYLELDVESLGGPLEVWGQPDIPGSTATPRVRLRQGPDLVADKAGLGEEGWLSWPTAVTGTTILEASDGAGAAGDDAWFLVYVRTYEPDDSHPFYGTNLYTPELEPNDTLAEGGALPADPEDDYVAYRMEGALELPGDQDWWVGEALAGDEVSVRCFTERFGSLAQVSVSVLDSVGDITPAGQGDADLGEDFYVDGAVVGATGSLWIGISGTGAASGPGHWYRCAVFVQ